MTTRGSPGPGSTPSPATPRSRPATGASTGSSGRRCARPASTAVRRARRAPRRRGNVTFHPSAAAAQGAGFRACKRCLPDATPGSPEWDVAAGAAGRAMRLVADGVVDREGVDGLARRLGLQPAAPDPAADRRAGCRSARPGPGPAGPDGAGADRDHRPPADRGGLRRRLRERAPVQPDTIREVYALTPSAAARAPERAAPSDRRASRCGSRCARRSPARRCSRSWPTTSSRASRPPEPGWYARTLDLPHGPGTVRVDLDPALDEVPAGGVAMVDGTLPAHRPARHRRGRRARTPPRRRRLRPAAGRRAPRRRPGPRAAGAPPAGPAAARTGRR